MAAMHALRYLLHSPNAIFFFPANNKFVLKAFCDTDWATCWDTRRSISSFYVYIGLALISWRSKKQTTIYHSSEEAEYHSMAPTICELLWISFLLKELQIQVPFPIDLSRDSQATIYISHNLVFHETTKHVEFDCHLVQDKLKLGLLSPIMWDLKLKLLTCLLRSCLHPPYNVFFPCWACFKFTNLQLEEGWRNYLFTCTNTTNMFSSFLLEGKVVRQQCIVS